MSHPPTEPLWNLIPLPEYPALTQDIEVDVTVVGAGLTGITTAYLLAQEGVRVALIERERVAGGDTSRTTAHLTYVTDKRLHELVREFGEQAAQRFWKGGVAAIDTIEAIVEATGNDAEFVRVPGYLHVPIGQEPSRKDVDLLRRDAELAAKFGFDVTFVDSMPFGDVPAVRFAEQAKFHPRRYLKGLLADLHRRSGLIF